MWQFVLKCDYSLSRWFASSKDRVLPGVSFLFLTKVSFVVFAVYAVIIRLIPYKLSISLVVGIPVLLTLLIMYGFQASIHRHTKSNGFENDFNVLTKVERKKRNVIGLLILFAIYVASFIVIIKMIGGYSRVLE